jgi:NAD(P)-dependent dehydrogenase (short-subunit alcohol dehydrogenase family)
VIAPQILRSLRDKREVVVVTGASAGLGRAVVREFAKHGASIGLLARDPGRLETAAREVEKLGGQAVVSVCDVADAAQVEAGADRVERSFGPIDIWVNNAMASVFSPIREMTPEEYDRVTAVTYLGAVHGTLAALERMLPRDRGTIVQVGSALSVRSIPLQSAYCAAKHALAGFTESLRCELIHDRSRVHVTEVHLPGLNTPQFEWSRSKLPRAAQPVPPIFQPEVAARAIYWAAHHRRREVRVGWPTVKAMIGDKIAPGLADLYLGRMGYEAQQRGELAPPGRPDNLFETVPGDFGAHGVFDAEARDHSWCFWLTKHRRSIAAGLAMGCAAWLATRRTQRWREDAASTLPA